MAIQRIRRGSPELRAAKARIAKPYLTGKARLLQKLREAKTPEEKEKLKTELKRIRDTMRKVLKPGL
jgi:hypothetical protein